MDVTVNLVSAFTNINSGGNPAGVVLNADALTYADKLEIANSVGYSETAFVTTDAECDFEVSFFTPTSEVNFCGHATLAAFFILHKYKHIQPGNYQQRTKAGTLAVSVDEKGDVVLDQSLPRKFQTFNYSDVAHLLSLTPAMLASTGLPIEVISTGLADLIIPVPRGQLDTLNANESDIIAFSKQKGIIGVHAFELSDPASGITASCRNFAPLYGIKEESATGSSCGALACYLFEHLKSHASNHFVFEQGRAMNCTSTIKATVMAKDDRVTHVRVGGSAREIGIRKLSI